MGRIGHLWDGCDKGGEDGTKVWRMGQRCDVTKIWRMGQRCGGWDKHGEGATNVEDGKMLCRMGQRCGRWDKDM